MGVVVSLPEQDTNYKALHLDDGTGRMEIRSFDNPNIFSGVAIGDIALVIGRPREYGNARYITAEIVRQIKNKRWLEVRKLELNSQPAAKEEKTAEETPESNSAPVYKAIKELDKGEGAETLSVIKEASHPEAEKIIQHLLKEGEIYEIAPGRLKILE